MENQNPQKHSDTIKGIEQSLLLLKSKIEQMQKEEARNVANIDKVFSSSIPILKNKLNQTQKMIQLEQKKNILKTMNMNRFQQITSNKLKHVNGLSKNREEWIKAKAYESQHIKEMSKKNDEIIENVKQKYREQNRKKTELIRQNKLRSKEKVQQFYLFKKYDLKKRKRCENEEIEKKLKNYQKQVKELERQEKETEEKVKKTQTVFKNLRYAVDKLSKMKEEEFKQLVEVTGIENPNDIKEAALDKILNEIVKNKKGQRSQSLNNTNLY